MNSFFIIIHQVFLWCNVLKWIIPCEIKSLVPGLRSIRLHHKTCFIDDFLTSYQNKRDRFYMISIFCEFKIHMPTKLYPFLHVYFFSEKHIPFHRFLLKMVTLSQISADPCPLWNLQPLSRESGNTLGINFSSSDNPGTSWTTIHYFVSYSLSTSWTNIQ